MNLVHNQSGKLIPAEITLVTSEELTANRGQFEFNWHAIAGCEIYGIRLRQEMSIVGLLALKNIPDELRIEIVLLESSKENVGNSKTYQHIAGCLIAFTCRLAFLRGYFGFVSLTPKTKLIKHYKNLYGFEQYGRQLAVDLERSQRLIEKYLNDER